MMVLIIGGSGSGKSSYAEKLLCGAYGGVNANVPKYYIATMPVNDDEDRKKVASHRNQREGKGFITIERTTDISGALEMMDSERKAVLLECVSNLTANEMFSQGSIRTENQVVEKVIKDMEQLKEHTEYLAVVSNNVFEDGIDYDDMTMNYIRTLGRINRRLAALADKVVEMAVGIPICLK